MLVWCPSRSWVRESDMESMYKELPALRGRVQRFWRTREEALQLQEEMETAGEGESRNKHCADLRYLEFYICLLHTGQVEMETSALISLNVSNGLSSKCKRGIEECEIE